MTDTPTPTPFKCSKCERLFSNQNNLDVHMLTHTDTPTPTPTPKSEPKLVATTKASTSSSVPEEGSQPSATTPKKLVIESVPEQEAVVQEIIPDILKEAEKQALKEAKTEKDAEAGIDQIFGTLQAKWNEVADTKPVEQGGNPADAYKLTNEDMKSLKNGIMLMDGKYHFLGKSLNYIPEIALSIAVITIAFKGFKMVQAKRSTGGGRASAKTGDSRTDDIQARADAVMAELRKEKGLA